jgi:hypothetical protein
VVNTEPKVEVFFVGVGKCGTSWLYEFIKRHDILSVPSLKEPYLIDEPPTRQAEIINKLYGRKTRMADFSNLYYWDPENAQKIHEYNPDARIIVTTRKPSNRIASHFGFLKRNGLLSDDSVAAYLNGPDPERIVDRSRYHDMIERYEAAFGAGRVLILPLEQLEQDPQSYANRFCDFISTTRVTLTEQDIKPVLRSARARNILVARLGKYAATTLRRFGLLSLLGHLKSSTLLRRILFKETVQDVVLDFGPLTRDIHTLDKEYEALLIAKNVKSK